MALIPHRLLMDAPDNLLKSMAVAWLQRRQLGAGRPYLGRPAWLWLASAAHCSVMLTTSCTFVLKLVWVLTDRLVTESGPIGLGVHLSVLTRSTCVEHLVFA